MNLATTHLTKTSIADRISQLPAEKRALFQRRAESRSPRGFELVARSLRECGITHIYGVAGQPTERVLSECLAEGVRPIGVYHQTSAVCMALAHNYQAARLVAAALVSAGPAVTNAVTGLLVARDNGWPVIVIGGTRSSFQNFESVPMIRHLTKHAMSVPSTAMIRSSIKQACRIAMSGRPGPVYLDLHEDDLHEYCNRPRHALAERLGRREFAGAFGMLTKLRTNQSTTTELFNELNNLFEQMAQCLLAQEGAA